LDRDGVIAPDTSVGAPAPYRAAAGAIADLNRLGWLVVVVTNQPAVARGLKTVAEVAAENDDLAREIAAQGGRIDAFYFCPHHPAGLLPEYALSCECRKPRPGLLFRARDSLGIDLSHSVMVGDRMTDIEAGARAGCAVTILVETGMHTAGRITTDDPPLDIEPGLRALDIAAAVSSIIERFPS
jgi:D-glycero-D-manno-heptose 1,7-bisphosphate phosphatase